MPTNPPTITALPTPPDPNDRSSFNVRAYPWSVAQQTFGAELSAVAANAFGNATEAAGSASGAADSAAEAVNAVTDAQAARDAAAASATSAVNAPGTSATSTTSLSLSAGTKSLTLVQTGKLFAIGQRIVIARTADPANSRMVGTLSSAVAGTGALVATVAFSDVRGSGTFTDWTISMAGESSTLPATTVPDAGKVLGVDGGGQYALIPAPTRGQGAGTASGNTTLTAASGAVQAIATTGPGQWVQLPAADTLTAGIAGFAIQNAGGWDLEIRDGSGAPIGYALPGQTATADPKNIGSVAGAWVLRGAYPYGTYTTEVSMPTSLNGGTLYVMLPLDGNRDLLVFAGSSNVYAGIWDQATGNIGTLVLIRAADVNNKCIAIKHSATQVLLLTIGSSTALQGVILDVGASGQTVTPGSAASLTLTNAVSAFSDLIPVVGHGYLLATYGSGASSGLVGITVTGGNVVNLGAELNITYNNTSGFTPLLSDAGGGKVLCISFRTSPFNDGAIQLVNVAGNVLTNNVGTTFGAYTTNIHFHKLASGRHALLWQSSTRIVQGGIISVVGSNATLSTLGSALLPQCPLGGSAVIGSQVVVCGGYYDTGVNRAEINLLSDNAGVAVQGTVIATAGFSQIDNVWIAAYDATTVTTVIGTGATGQNNGGYFQRWTPNGNNLALVAAENVVGGGTPSTGGYPYIASAAQNGKAKFMTGVMRGSFGSLLNTGSSAAQWYMPAEGFTPIMLPRKPGPYFPGASGGNRSWVATAITSGTKYVVSKMKLA